MGIKAEISRSVFEYFIDDQYGMLKNQLVDDGKFVEDVFHQTLLDIWDDLKFDLEPTLQRTSVLFETYYKVNLLQYHKDRLQLLLFDNSVMEFILSKK